MRRAALIGAVNRRNATAIPEILYWKCDEGTGATVGATVGVGSTNYNGTWSTIGAANALGYTGSNYADSSSVVNYGTNEITIKMKIKPTSWSAGSSSFTLLDSTATSVGEYAVRIYNQFNILYVIILSGGVYAYAAVSATTYLGAGSSHDLSIYAKTNSLHGTFKIFCDGVQPALADSGSSGNMNGSNFTNKVLTLGADTAHTVGGSFRGAINEFKIFSGDKTP